MMNNPTARAVLWMAGAVLSLLSVSVLAKLLAEQYQTFEIMFYRSIFGFIVFALFLAITGQFSQLKVRVPKKHLVRNILHFSAQNLWFFALGSAIPLSIVIAFEFTTPAWVIVFAALILREGFGIRRLIVIVLSLIGVVIITGPSDLSLDFALFSAIVAAIFFALTMIATKDLTRHQSVNEILIMMTFLQGVFAGLIILLQGKLEPIHIEFLPWLFLIGMAGTMSHYCLTKALNLVDASIVSPIDLARLPLSIFLGFLLFGEHIALSVIVGTLFLILANYINIQIKAKRS